MLTARLLGVCLALAVEWHAMVTGTLALAHRTTTSHHRTSQSSKAVVYLEFESNPQIQCVVMKLFERSGKSKSNTSRNLMTAFKILIASPVISSVTHSLAYLLFFLRHWGRGGLPVNGQKHKRPKAQQRRSWKRRRRTTTTLQPSSAALWT